MSQRLVFCPQCGTPLDDPGRNGLEFCTQCGKTWQNVVPKHQPSPSAHFSPETQTLSDEYRSLKRPRPSVPLNVWGCLLIFGLAWTISILFGLVFAFQAFMPDYLDYKLLALQGFPANATITDLETGESDDSATYTVYYQFRAPINGDLIDLEGYDTVSSSLYIRLQIGGEIEILYAPSRPDLTAVRSEFGFRNLLGQMVFIGVGVLFALAGLFMVYAGARALIYWFLLGSGGKKTQAIILDRWREKNWDGCIHYLLAYAFKTDDGQIITRAEQNTALYQQHQIGSILTVRYLPARPSVSKMQDTPGC